ncbi:MAG: aldo/keto reductase [Alphaproteobacteria bacterium]|nr:aldo/keto reductase [Alphaproteobacteria bacterium]
MDPVRLGRSGLYVSPVCLGTMMFGGPTPPEDARRIADMALDRGVFFWDTADMYNQGRSEEVCAELMKGRREQIVLATKVWAPMGPGPNDKGLGARHVLAACEASLKRLGTDWIDLYYLHLPDREVPMEESLRACEDLVRSGKVRYLAISNHQAWEVARTWHLAREHGWQPLSAIQPLYNIVNRDIEWQMLPMARHYGLGVVSYSPLARGVLTGKYRWGEAPPEGSRLARSDKRLLQAEWREDSVRVAAAVVEAAEARGCTPAQLATAWAMKHVDITSVIIGPRTVAQAEDALGAAEVEVDEDFERLVDDLVPPGSHSGRGWPDEQYAVLPRQVKA